MGEGCVCPPLFLEVYVVRPSNLVKGSGLGSHGKTKFKVGKRIIEGQMGSDLYSHMEVKLGAEDVKGRFKVGHPRSITVAFT